VAENDRWLTRNDVQSEFPSLGMDKIQDAVTKGQVKTQGTGGDLKYSYTDLQAIAGGTSRS